MLRLCWSLLFAFTALASDPHSNALRQVPDELTSERHPAAWVAADVAVRADGTLRSEVLRQRADVVRQHAEAEAARARKAAAARSSSATKDDCHSAFGGAPNFEPTVSAEALVSQSRIIVHGRIEAIREGFYNGRPGSMLRLSGSYLRGSAPEETYVFYPAAKIRLENATLCAQPPRQYPLPRVGDELIVFAASAAPPRFGNRVVLWVNVRHDVVYIPADAAAVLPAPLASLSSTPNPVDAVLSLIHEGSAQPERQRKAMQ